jgi:hypothetical protein
MRHSTLLRIYLVVILFISLATSMAMADKDPNGNATVSFGAWQTPLPPPAVPPETAPLDRFPIDSPANRNEHQLLPHEVKIKAGGAVNFVIGGFHQVIVYDDGTQPGDIGANPPTTPSTGAPSGVALINVAANRLYRGLDPSRLHLVDPVMGAPSLGVRDRAEVVFFPNPGTYLVICGIRNHFVNDGMFGFVTVLP